LRVVVNRTQISEFDQFCEKKNVLLKLIECVNDVVDFSFVFERSPISTDMKILIEQLPAKWVSLCYWEGRHPEFWTHFANVDING